jgi:hypothetical protein
VCQDQSGGIDLHAFTTRQGLEDQLYNTCTLGDSSFVVQEAPLQVASGIAVYEGPRWSGASYFLPSGQSVVLAESWWDDRISSLRGFGAGTVVTFFESPDSGGSTLTMTTDLGWPDLDVFGWDGRASSVVVSPLALGRVPVTKPF